jgi:cold shock CspA family protein
MSFCTNAVTTSTDTPRLLGRVKWFNNRAGYGFITVTDGSRSGSDIFVHHSSVKVDSEQYKYLVQGEYVEFILLSTPNGEHEFQAGDVSGVKGGKLMCETRRETREARTQYHTEPHGQSRGNEWVYDVHREAREAREARGSARGSARGRGRGNAGRRNPRVERSDGYVSRRRTQH